MTSAENATGHDPRCFALKIVFFPSDSYIAEVSSALLAVICSLKSETFPVSSACNYALDSTSCNWAIRLVYLWVIARDIAASTTLY